MTRTRKALLLLLLPVVSIVALLAAYVAWVMYLGIPVPAAKPDTIKVACVGDSITFGNPIFASERYPQQLEALLGSGYSVRNFGIPALTAQKAGDHPYWKHPYFERSSEFAPDVVVIMLGTNDSKPQNWSGVTRFEQDMRALIQHYQSLPSKPRMILVTPPSTFLLPGKKVLPSGMNADAITEISNSIKQTGATLGLAVADVHAATASHPEFFKLDGVHPDAEGQSLIAKMVQDALQTGPAK